MKERCGVSLVILILFLFSGCGGGSGGGGSASSSSIDGYIYQKNSARAKAAEFYVGKEVPSGFSAVSSVTITLTGTSLTATTDTSGYFTVSNVSPGTYTLSAAKDGYETTSLTLTVSQGQNTRIGDVPQTSANLNYFPLTVGNTWTYNVSHTIGPFKDPTGECLREPTLTDYTATGTGKYVYTIEGTKIINNVTTSTLKWDLQKTWNTGSSENSTSRAWFAWDNNQLKIYAANFYSTSVEPETVFSTPYIKLITPLYPGTLWTNTETDDAWIGGTITVASQEAVITKAGTFQTYKISNPSFGTYLYEWYAAQGMVKLDYIYEDLENWQVTDYDPDEGTADDLNTGVEDTFCNNEDLFDDKVELLSTFSNHETYELTSYSVQAKMKEEHEESIAAERTPTLAKTSAPPQNGDCEAQQFLFYPNPLRSTQELTLRYDVPRAKTQNAAVTITSLEKNFSFTQELQTESKLKQLSPSGLSPGIYAVTLETSCTDGTTARATKLLAVIK